LPKSEIQVLTTDGEADKVANTIVTAAASGKIGDGKLWILPVETAIRLRTGEVGDDAI
jgi:nitrogen regulatory protein P-II 1